MDVDGSTTSPIKHRSITPTPNATDPVTAARTLGLIDAPTKAEVNDRRAASFGEPAASSPDVRAC
jgi:hypothetical protein